MSLETVDWGLAVRQDYNDLSEVFSTRTSTTASMRPGCANIALIIPGEEKVDLHSFRVTYVTLVFEAGVNPNEGQTLARNANPQLTMDIYARARKERLAEVVDKLGRFVLEDSKRAYATHPLNSKNPKSFVMRGLGSLKNGGGGGIRTRVRTHGFCSSTCLGRINFPGVWLRSAFARVSSIGSYCFHPEEGSGSQPSFLRLIPGRKATPGQTATRQYG